MDSIGQVLDKINYISLFNAVTGIFGSGPFGWATAGLIALAGMYFLKKIKDWVKKSIYDASQKDIGKTQTDVKNDEKKIDTEVKDAEKKTADVIAAEPVVPGEPEKPHRPVPAETVKIERNTDDTSK